MDSKSGTFGLEDSRLRHTDALKRLYLIAAVAILYATTTGMTVTITGLRTNARPSLATKLPLLGATHAEETSARRAKPRQGRMHPQNWLTISSWCD